MSAIDDALHDGEELHLLLTTRRYVYELFHKLFGAAPNADVLAMLVSNTTQNIVDEYATENETMVGFAQFIRMLAATSDKDRLLSDIRDEYTRLFWAPGVLPVCVWESPYRTHEVSVFQENTLALRQLYANYGLQAARIQRVPDDHIALMCAFVSSVADDALGSFCAGDFETTALRLQESLLFVRNHLCSWLPECAKRMRATQTAVLYPQLFEAAAAFVELDATFLLEALFWIETHANNTCIAQPMVWRALSTTEVGEVCAQIEQTTDMLCALSPFGIADNELVPIEKQNG